jgi:hypothetical protein
MQSIASASTILVPPENLDLKELNADRPRKLTNRYSDVGQINNQYKGELLYKPDNNGVVTYRDGRFYVSAHFFTAKFSPKEIEHYDGTILSFDVDKNRFSYFGSFGYYFNRNMGIEFEYFDYTSHIAGLVPNIYNSIGEFSINTKNYVINLLGEINEARVIPFVGGGLGVARNDFTNYSAVDNPTIENIFVPMYQIILGLEFTINEQLLFSCKYKFHGTFKDLKINSDYKIKYDVHQSLGFGFKYIL